MKCSRFNRWIVLGAVFGCILFLAPTTLNAQQPRHLALHKALHDLRHARAELQEAKGDFGGHRAKAIAAIDAAVIQIEKALVSQKDFNFKGIKDKDANENKLPNGPFPRLRLALEGLQEARTELSNANHNFGGHKDKAIQDIDEAILQIGLGVKSALKK